VKYKHNIVFSRCGLSLQSRFVATVNEHWGQLCKVAMNLFRKWHLQDWNYARHLSSS